MHRPVLVSLLLATILGASMAPGLTALIPWAMPDAERAYAQVGVPVTLSGRVFDGRGQPIQNQRVALSAGIGVGASVLTDASGDYSLTVSSGTQSLSIDTDPMHPNPLGAAVPANYALSVSPPLNLVQNTTLNLTIPAKAVTVHVVDQSNVPIAGATVSSPGVPVSGVSLGTVTAAGVCSTGFGPQQTTDTNGNATIWLLPTSTQGYGINVTPPSGSPLRPGALNNVAVAADMNVSITLFPPVTLSGRVFDGRGQPLQFQRVALSAGINNGTSATTDASGAYSLSVSPGTHSLSIDTDPMHPNPPGTAVPINYALSASSQLNLTQNTTLDLSIPAKAVTVRVLGAGNVPIAGATVSSPGVPVSGVSLGSITAAGVCSTGFGPQQTTDTNGNATIWLLPTSTQGYSINVSPPSGSQYSAGVLSNVAVAGDMNVSITFSSPVTLSGRVFDGRGQPLQFQRVALNAGINNGTSATTDASGAYSLSVSPGTHSLSIDTDPMHPNPLTVAAPTSYSLSAATPLTLTQDTTLDLTVPAKAVTVRVLKPDGSPLAGVTISTPGVPVSGVQLGSLTAAGTCSTGFGAQQTTDVNGNATIWLLPTTPNAFVSQLYALTIVPPGSSGFLSFQVQGVAVAGDMTETVRLGQTFPLGTVVAGSTTVPVRSSGGFRAGQTVTFNPGGSTQESAGLVSVGPLVLDQPLRFDHGPNEPIMVPAVACNTPRPSIAIQVVRAGPGQLRATLTAPTGGPLIGNGITTVRIERLDNVQVDLVGGANNLAAGTVVQVAGQPTTIALIARRQAAGPFTARITVSDACGPFSTFVGGGADVP